MVQQVAAHHPLSQRRVCQALGFSRSSVRYAPSPTKQERDQALAERLRRLALEHPRFGSRRAGALLNREEKGQERKPLNHKRVQRAWKTAGLSLPRRRPKKRHPASQVSRIGERAVRPNHIWCYDFVHDECANGAKLKILTLEDEFTRESLALEVGGSMTASAVVVVLSRVFAERGAPSGIRSDNGPEFIAEAVKNWLHEQQVQTHYIEPGSPWQNGIAESFNGKLRDECLSREWFKNRAEARVLLARYQRYYNEERPHSSLGYQTPAEFRQAFLNAQAESDKEKD